MWALQTVLKELPLSSPWDPKEHFGGLHRGCIYFHACAFWHLFQYLCPIFFSFPSALSSLCCLADSKENTAAPGEMMYLHYQPEYPVTPGQAGTTSGSNHGKALHNDLSGVCRAVYLETYAAVFPYAIKYNLLFPSNLGLYSLGHIKAKCHAFAAKSLQQECPWWKSCPYYWVWSGLETADSARKRWLSIFPWQQPTWVTHLTKASHSLGCISYHWLHMKLIVLPICWHLSLYGEMRPHFTSRCSTWISAMCSELLTLHFEICLVKNTSRLVKGGLLQGGDVLSPYIQ